MFYIHLDLDSYLIIDSICLLLDGALEYMRVVVHV